MGRDKPGPSLLLREKDTGQRHDETPQTVSSPAGAGIQGNFSGPTTCIQAPYWVTGGKRAVMGITLSQFYTILFVIRALVDAFQLSLQKIQTVLAPERFALEQIPGHAMGAFGDGFVGVRQPLLK